MPDTALDSLLALSHSLGRPDLQLAILGEGNTSTRLDADTFLVKASGSSLSTLTPDGVVRCYSAPLISLLDARGLSDTDVDNALLESRVDKSARKPSVEALFHAYLLSLPGINFVGHTHPITAHAFLCSDRAREFADTRLFPDEIVCCGRVSAFVPYTDPGLVLSQAIRKEVESFQKDAGELPRVILLQNHGVITLGGSPQAVEAAMFMCEKAARIRVGAAAVGQVVTLTEQEVNRIAHRPDEHHRRKALNI